VRIVAGETIAATPNATSLVFYAIDGSGAAAQGSVRFQFAKGDFFTMPGGAEVKLAAD
jgi:gentisate 1,2-dioxygenase